jgi:hypothetical protein
MHGGQVPAVVAAVGRFADHRHADLWSGVGLAATFAGGGTPPDLARLREAAGWFRPELALGSVFAVKARTFAGYLPEHTEAAVAALTGLDTPAAVGLADSTEVPPDAGGEVPAYELWRQRIRASFAPPAAGRVAS